MTQKFLPVRKDIFCFHMVLVLLILGVGAQGRGKNHRNENMGMLQREFKIVVPETTCECKSTRSSVRAQSQTLPSAMTKNWQVDRLWRRPYDVVTVLWRKTKIFDDVEESTQSVLQDITYKFNTHKFKRQDTRYQSSVKMKPPAVFLTQVQRPLSVSSKSTISNIEFDYSDDINDNRYFNISNKITSRRHLLFKAESQSFYTPPSILLNKMVTTSQKLATTTFVATTRRKRSHKYRDNSDREFQFVNFKFMGHAFPYKISYEAKFMPVQMRSYINQPPIKALSKTTKNESEFLQNFHFSHLPKQAQKSSTEASKTSLGITQVSSTFLVPLGFSRLQKTKTNISLVSINPYRTNFISKKGRPKLNSFGTENHRPEFSLYKSKNSELQDLFFTLGRPKSRATRPKKDIFLESFTTGPKVLDPIKTNMPVNFTRVTNFPQSMFDGSKIKTATTEFLTTETFTTPESFYSEIVIIETKSPKREFTKTKTTEHLTINKKYSPAYDRIKFFEIYDENTEKSYFNPTPISLENVHNVNDTKMEHASKIDKRANDVDTDDDDVNNLSNRIIIDKSTPVEINSESKTSFTETEESESSRYTKRIDTKPTILKITYLQTKSKIELKSTKVDWKQFPFAAAYIHEPSQVHCDAAALSTHWLTTSGSCLHRHHESVNPSLGGLSAFVAYCGSNWRDPEHITYVKYSVVHPKYHPKDEARRHLYNIGLIQVVNSMSMTCPGWYPISLMSHQFASDVTGSPAYAVGWGLNRHNEKTIANAKGHLMHYEGIIFTDSCPGSKEYKNLRRLPKQGGINNVYCMSLPPYRGESEDPVHGGLLFVGSKLIALYLQEERRFSGEQCAQYTGVWRLIPWVLKIAREPDENTFY